MFPKYRIKYTLVLIMKIFYWVCIILSFFPLYPVLSMDRIKTGNSSVSSSSSGIISFYQKYISPVDGDRCPMYPSCSQYIKKSIHKHGYIMGWIMGMDRLVRCGRDEVYLSPHIWKNGRRYTYDPVKNNDFWWSDK